VGKGHSANVVAVKLFAYCAHGLPKEVFGFFHFVMTQLFLMKQIAVNVENLGKLVRILAALSITALSISMIKDGLDV
jgi:EamA domain-containing membrane protein RarD